MTTDGLGVVTWVKSSYSGSNGGNCVEVGRGGGIRGVPVRDSKDPQGPAIVCSRAAWASFVAFAVGCGA
ncbi:DUF397 domain-containing protein [Streptomyces varsoviensis]|uniref:DUF397 domain-containing protein n=1 Tax=Streptomyces varsoviensis TaxID=67373 RepID=UPI0033D90B38